jgi:hypothetical protein
MRNLVVSLKRTNLFLYRVVFLIVKNYFAGVKKPARAGYGVTEKFLLVLECGIARGCAST